MAEIKDWTGFTIESLFRYALTKFLTEDRIIGKYERTKLESEEDQESQRPVSLVLGIPFVTELERYAKKFEQLVESCVNRLLRVLMFISYDDALFKAVISVFKDWCIEKGLYPIFTFNDLKNFIENIVLHRFNNYSRISQMRTEDYKLWIKTFIKHFDRYIYRIELRFYSLIKSKAIDEDGRNNEWIFDGMPIDSYKLPLVDVMNLKEAEKYYKLLRGKSLIDELEQDLEVDLQSTYWHGTYIKSIYNGQEYIIPEVGLMLMIVTGTYAQNLDVDDKKYSNEQREQEDLIVLKVINKLIQFGISVNMFVRYRENNADADNVFKWITPHGKSIEEIYDDVVEEVCRLMQKHKTLKKVLYNELEYIFKYYNVPLDIREEIIKIFKEYGYEIIKNEKTETENINIRRKILERLKGLEMM